eukprot:TRINITY_DN45980_c1_g1_i3.p4 TRINITY_DN45980_c1_g1~~TRINITY_DN45980_c1_g1_i3.p4  ORF type:complete len:150 (-),score=8.62 TRINITY_DN45980_c1_g1_i3:14-463(-)
MVHMLYACVCVYPFGWSIDGMLFPQFCEQLCRIDTVVRYGGLYLRTILQYYDLLIDTSLGYRERGMQQLLIQVQYVRMHILFVVGDVVQQLEVQSRTIKRIFWKMYNRFKEIEIKVCDVKSVKRRLSQALNCIQFFLESLVEELKRAKV